MKNTFLTLLALIVSLSVYGQTAMVQIIHNAADPAAASVDIYVNGSLLLDNFEFREATGFLAVPANVPVNIGVAPPTSTSVTDTIANFTVTLDSNTNYVVIANGVLGASFAANPDSKPITFSLYPLGNAQMTGQGGNSNVDFAIFHGATDAPTVSIYANNAALSTGLAYGEFTSYASVPAAGYRIDIRNQAGTTDIISYYANLSGLGGKAAVVFASGFLNPSANSNGPGFGVFAALTDGTVVGFPVIGEAALQVIHNCADPAANQVDIYVNGTLTLDDFGFRQATPYITIPSNIPIVVGIAPGNSASYADTLVTYTLTFETGKNYVAIAIGLLTPGSFAANPDGINTGFTVLVKEDTRLAANAGSGEVDFFVLHGATDAPAVDVLARNVGALVSGASFGDMTGYINVPAGDYVLDITPAGNNSTVVASYTAPLSGLGGGAAVVFASGFLNPATNNNGSSFGLFAALPTGQVIALDAFTSVLEKQSTVQEIKTFPNPANTTLKLSLNLTEPQLTKVEFLSISGASLFVEEHFLKMGTNLLEFSIDNYPNGNYFISVTSNGFTRSLPVTILK